MSKPISKVTHATGALPVSSARERDQWKQCEEPRSNMGNSALRGSLVALYTVDALRWYASMDWGVSKMSKQS